MNPEKYTRKQANQYALNASLMYVINVRLSQKYKYNNKDKQRIVYVLFSTNIIF